ncbi:S-protein homolog 2 [Cajanus cajan]|uniref:Uncharacterized protein n=1 Tax=Cajanus cajan TaxID=3821 RepID=A0A151TBN1_CAJCA|nr:S-protein homolog 2 [Cajanus cajan]KYP64436.1 hypothetical protein KK1_019033 [Cajanus cajan]
MSLFARRVSMVWVLMLFLLWTNNAAVVKELRIVVRNALAGNLDLTVSCNNIEAAHRLIKPDLVFEWIYTGGVSPAKLPFLCSFQWQGSLHSFNMFDPVWDFDCYPQCRWFVKQSGPCRWYYDGAATSFLCSKWNN